MIRNYYKENADSVDKLKTAISSIQSKYSAFNPSDASNGAKDGLNQIVSGSASMALEGKNLIDRIISAFAAALSDVKLGLPKEKKSDGEESDSGIPMLIKIILGIIQMPVRFAYFFAGLAEGAAALALSLDGLGKSVSLGAKDIFILIMAIFNLLFKYFLCILSFIITTIGGCFFIHVVTFTLYVVLLIFPLTAYFVKQSVGYDLNPFFDKGFEMAAEADEQQANFSGIYLTRWPDPINMVCYTCFGKKVKLREVITDFAAIQEIGDMITNDFTVVMPDYLKNGKPIGEDALKNLDKAFN
jgi:hypothetical protein